MSDEELARESQAGSVAAFEVLVSRYERRVHAFAAQCCGNAAEAGDVAQEAFVRAFQAIGQYNPGRSFAAWLFTIARRKAIDRHRSAPVIAEEPVPEGAEVQDPAEILARAEERQALWALARRSLPPLQYQVIWLRYAEELSVADIATVLRRTRVHVKVLLFRARRSLAQALGAATRRSEATGSGRRPVMPGSISRLKPSVP